MSKFDSNNFGTGWGMPQNDLNQGQGYSMPSYINGMDFASDGYQNSGVSNIGGLSYGQSVGGGAAPAAGGMFSGLSQWGKDSGFLGSTDAKGIKTDGWGGAAMGAANSIFNAYMGMKQYGLAKQQFAFNKDMTTRNFNAQANLTNSKLADRQSARRAAGENVQDVDGYMGQYGVKKA